MNIYEFIKNNGLKEVPNPLYNPKSKKNKQPKTIIVRDINKDEYSPSLDLSIKSLDEQQSIEDYKVEKYNKHGITWSPKNRLNIDAELEDAQSNWTKAGNSLAQTLVSEFGLGTAKAFSDIGGAIYETFAEIFSNQERDYQNPISNEIQEWQDYFNDKIAPVHLDPNVDIQNGGFSHFAWYAKNFPQLASTLTLLIPTMTVAGGIDKLNKAFNIGNKVSTARRWASRVNKIEDAKELNKFQLAINNPLNIERANEGVKLFGDAMVMRTIENYQEARDTHIQTYQMASEKLNNMDKEDYDMWLQAQPKLREELKNKEIDSNDRDKVAKHLATKAADRTFAMDFSNIVFDIIQLYGLKNYGKKLGEIKGREIDTTKKEIQATTEEYANSLKPKTERINPSTTTNATQTPKPVPVNAEKASKSPFFKNTFNIVKDFLKYNGKTILAESSEGIEEAVNYIAQQEGITYGKMLLKGEDDYNGNRFTGIWKSWNNLQNPLDDYLKSSELQESAFWGLMGGFVF